MTLFQYWMATRLTSICGISLGETNFSNSINKSFYDRVNSLTLRAAEGDSGPTIQEMDTSILDFISKAGTVNWTNEDSVVNYLIRCGKN